MSEEIVPASRNRGERSRGSNGRRKLKVIGPEPMAAALDIAVSRALRARMPKYDARAVAGIQGEVRATFKSLLHKNGKAVRGVSKSRFLLDLERSRDKLLQDRDSARDELLDLRTKAELFRSVQHTDEKLLKLDGSSGGDMVAIAKRFQEVFELGRKGALSPSEVERRILALVEALSQDERRRTLEQRAQEFDREAVQYERRISKLNNSLERSESALLQLSRMKDVEGGISSIYRAVQGLDPEADQMERKRSLLLQIFEANLVLQKV